MGRWAGCQELLVVEALEVTPVRSRKGVVDKPAQGRAAKHAKPSTHQLLAPDFTLGSSKAYLCVEELHQTMGPPKRVPTLLLFCLLGASRALEEPSCDRQASREVRSMVHQVCSRPASLRLQPPDSMKATSWPPAL